MKNQTLRNTSEFITAFCFVWVDAFPPIRVPTGIQKHNSMIFPWFSVINKCNFHDYLMHSLEPPLL